MNWKTLFFSKKTIWILLGLLTMLLSSLLPPEVVERFYSRGLFVGVRWMISWLWGWLPFAMVYVLFFVLLFWLVRVAARFFNNKKRWWQKLAAAAYSLLAFAGGVIFFFQFLWGFNYGRIPLENVLGIEPEPLSINELRSELDTVTEEVLRLRAILPGAGDDVISAGLTPPGLEKHLRAELKKLLSLYGFPTPGDVRGRLLYPQGLLLRISTAGVYIPFTGEGHIDPGLHHLQLPFVMIHEMSHGYGFGDEGTCNFLAYLVCLQSEDPFLNYVGHLYYWRYVAGDYRAFDPAGFQEIMLNLPAGMKADLAAIQEQMAKFPDILPAVRDAAYTAYLQAQGIHEGLKNYDRVIMLVHAWRKRIERVGEVR